MHIVSFVVAMAAFVLGVWLFGLAFTVTVWQGPIFVAGILAVSAAIAIPVHVLRD
jgi:hypothetical protein